MDTEKSSVHFFCGPVLPVIGLSVMFFITALAAQPGGTRPDNTEKSAVMHRTAQDWMQVGAELCARGLYQKAQAAFNRAGQYEFYLTPDQRQRLTQLLQEAQLAPAEREQILQVLEKADRYITQRQYENAKAELEKVRENQFLTTAEQKHIAEKIKIINDQWLLRKKQLTALYDRSVKFYRQGQLQKARDGFNEVAASDLLAPNIRKIAQDYLARIDQFLSQAPPSLSSLQDQSPDKSTYPQEHVTTFVDKNASRQNYPINQVHVPDFAATAAEPNVQLESLNRKKSVLRSYATALINDAIDKAQKHLTQGRFYKASKALDAAEEAVNENRLYLGGDAVSAYHSRIKALAEQINAARSQWLGTWDQAAPAPAPATDESVNN